MANYILQIPTISLGNVSLGAVTIDPGVAHIGSVTLDTEGGATGAAVPARAVQVAGEDSGGDLKALAVTTSGELITANIQIDNTAVSTVGMTVGGTDGTNYQHLSVTNAGELNIAGSGTTANAVPAKAIMVGGSDGTDLIAMSVSPDGQPIILGAQEDGQVASQYGIMMCGTDGTLGQTLSCNSNGVLNVTPAATENVLGFTTAKLIASSGEFTRPADTTAYASGDCVSSSTSAPAVQALTNCARVSGGSGWIVGMELSKSTLSSTAVSFRVHLFNTSKTPTNDNSALVLAYTDKEEYLGYADFQVVGNSAFTASFGFDNSSKIPFVSSGTSLWWVLEVRGSYTPGNAETFYLKAKVLQN